MSASVCLQLFAEGVGVSVIVSEWHEWGNADRHVRRNANKSVLVAEKLDSVSGVAAVAPLLVPGAGNKCAQVLL